MTDKITYGAAGIAGVILLFGGYSLAFADINLQDFGFKVNGNTSDTIQPGDDFEITVNTDVNGGDEVEFFRIRLYDTGNSVVSTDCQAVGRVRDVNDENVRFNTETPSDIPNGAYKIKLLPFGIPGEAQSNGCDLTNDYPGDEQSYSGRLFVDDDEEIVGNPGNGGGSSTGGESQIDKLIKLISAWFAAQQNPTPAPSSKCSLLASASVTTSGLQVFLISNGESIPAIVPGGAAYGYYGPQTAAAVASFKAKNSCI